MEGRYIYTHMDTHIHGHVHVYYIYTSIHTSYRMLESRKNPTVESSASSLARASGVHSLRTGNPLTLCVPVGSSVFVGLGGFGRGSDTYTCTEERRAAPTDRPPIRSRLQPIHQPTHPNRNAPSTTTSFCRHSFPPLPPAPCRRWANRARMASRLLLLPPPEPAGAGATPASSVDKGMGKGYVWFD